MHRNQNGFTFVGVLLLITIVILCVGWTVYERNKKLSENSVEKTTYVFKSVPVDVSTFHFTPFQGFTFYYPENWRIQDSGNFHNQPNSGDISKPIYDDYTTIKSTTIYSPNLQKSEKDFKKQSYLDPLDKGARIHIVMGLNKPPSSPTSNCSAKEKYYVSRVVEQLNFKSFVACQVKLSENQYVISTETAKVSYRAELLMNKKVLSAQKNYYISALRSIVQSFQLY